MNSRKMFNMIESEMNDIYFERAPVIRGLIASMIAQQHPLLIGPPGTGKSDMVRNLCGRLEGGNYFSWLLSRTTTPDELFGPVSLAGLEQDVYRRITAGKFPTAHIAFLDEIWKCNAAVLNATLSIVNERIFYNDGKPERTPTEMVVGASNELPENPEEMQALYDRFAFRYLVGYVESKQSFKYLMYDKGRKDAVPTPFTLERLHKAHAICRTVKTQHLIDAIWKVREQLREREHIQPSDRRWKWGLMLVRANAYLDGRREIIAEDLMMYANVLWQEPDQKAIVERHLREVVNEYSAVVDAGETIRRVENMIEDARQALQSTGSMAVPQTCDVEIMRLIVDLENKAEEVDNRGRDATDLRRAVRQIRQLKENFANECLQITGADSEEA